MTIGLILRALAGSFWLRIAGAALAGLLAIKGYGLYQRQIGANQATQKIAKQSEKAGKEANAKASKAHDSAAKPGAAQRVLSKYCRDCN